MSWNEPGNKNGSGGKDPWGQGNRKEEGPPDLDEVFRQFQDRLRNMMGGKSGGNGARPQGPKLGGVGFSIAAIIFLGIYVLLGIFVVDPAEEAVVTRFGQYNRTVGAGPHWLAPFIEQKSIVNVQKVETTTHGGEMLTMDKNIIDVSIAAQFRIEEPKSFLFNVEGPISSLQQVTESALRAVVGQSLMDEILTKGRDKIGDDVLQTIQTNMDNYQTGIRILDLAMLPSKPPEPVKAAFDDVIKAGQDQQRFVNEAEAYANKIVPVAEGRAKRVTEEANAYKQEVILDAQGQTTRFDAILPEYKRAPEVTRDRLYLDAMQGVYSQSTKIVVDVDGGNNLFYMPLDKLAANLPAITKNHDNDDAIGEPTPKPPVTTNPNRSTTRQGYSELVRSRRGGN